PPPLLRGGPASLVLPWRGAERRVPVGGEPGDAAARVRAGRRSPRPDQAPVRRDSRGSGVLRGLPGAAGVVGKGEGRDRGGEGARGRHGPGGGNLFRRPARREPERAA